MAARKLNSIQLYVIIFVVEFIAAFAWMTYANAADWPPPAIYDAPYTGKMTVKRVPPQHVRFACNALFTKYGLEPEYFGVVGCSVVFDEERICHVITIDRPFNGDTPKAVLRHEQGHCNGWLGHHPQ